LITARLLTVAVARECQRQVAVVAKNPEARVELAAPNERRQSPPLTRTTLAVTTGHVAITIHVVET